MTYRVKVATVVPGDLAERERVGLGRHLRVLKLAASGHERIQDACLLDVYHVGHKLGFAARCCTATIVPMTSKRKAEVIDIK